MSLHPCEGDGRFSLEVDRMEPERLFSWNWRPSALQAGDGTTHVEFRLEDQHASDLRVNPPSIDKQIT